MRAFGVRQNETLKLDVVQAEVPTDVLPESAGSVPCPTSLRIDSGARGGKVCFIPIYTDEQRRLLVNTREIASRRGVHNVHG